jgi:hypothetical protein
MTSARTGNAPLGRTMDAKKFPLTTDYQGPQSTAPLKWRRHAHRTSCFDLVTPLRKEIVDHPGLVQALQFQLTDRSLTQAAAA